MTKHRVTYFDYLRIIAAFAVIVLHLSASGLVNCVKHSFEWNIFNAGDALTRWGVPVFVMISGALFLEKKPQLETLFKKNILKIVISLFFWSFAYELLYALQSVLYTHNIHCFNISIRAIIDGQTHLWFLYMLLGLYLIIPFLIKIVENEKTAIYFVILSFIFAFFIPQSVKYISKYSELAADTINSALEKMHMFFVLGYSGYFVLGYLLNNSEIKKKTEIMIYILGVISAFFTILTSSYDNLTVNVFFMSSAVFVFGKKHLSKPIKNDRALKKLLFFSKCCFGIYLIHPYVIEVIGIFTNVSVLSFNPLLSIPLLSIIVFIISMSISFCLNKTPVVKDWIV